MRSIHGGRPTPLNQTPSPKAPLASPAAEAHMRLETEMADVRPLASEADNAEWVANIVPLQVSTRG